MAQRIFDRENEKDMTDLWDIVPEDIEAIEKITPNSVIYRTNLGLRSGCQYIKINWHNKTEITRPIQEATEADLGKLCYFWDNCCEDIIIGKLTVVERNKGHTYYRLGNYAVFDHCRRLTKQEIEELC